MSRMMYKSGRTLDDPASLRRPEPTRRPEPELPKPAEQRRDPVICPGCTQPYASDDSCGCGGQPRAPVAAPVVDRLVKALEGRPELERELRERLFPGLAGLLREVADQHALPAGLRRQVLDAWRKIA